MSQGKKIPTYNEERLNSMPKAKYDDNAETMCNYHRQIIIQLAKNFSDNDLTERLKDLRFCSLETALEVLKEYNE